MFKVQYLADGLKRTGRITEALRAMLVAQTIRPDRAELASLKNKPASTS
jgi:hypothetical protein